jgi:ribosomal protein S3AE
MAVKKKFISIDLPLIESNVSALGTPESLNGKTIKIDLTRKLRGKGLEILFKIYNKNGLYGLPKQLYLMKFFIRRVMRKRASYVEDSFEAQCKDSIVIIKPFLVTRKKVSRAIRNNLRNTCRNFLINYVKDKNYLELCEEILFGTLQKEMLPKLKKVYPLSFSDLRVFESKEIDKIDYVYEKKERKSIEINGPKKEKEEDIEEIKEKTKEE